MDTHAASLRLLLARPRGFCAGVVRAVEVVERALLRFGAPVYVLHEIVHNGHVVRSLRERGAVFVDRLEEIPAGAVTIFSAHGVADRIVTQARERALRVIDATCPLVAKVHAQARRHALAGRLVIIIGHPGHAEVVGTLGSVGGPAVVLPDVAAARSWTPPPGRALGYVTQTTLSVDDAREVIAVLQQRFPGLEGPALSDICYATQNRQSAVIELAAQVERVLVVGARNSSNAARLREVAAQQGVSALLIEDEREIDPAWLHGVRRLGVTAAASTPDILVQRVCERLRQLGATSVRELPGRPENVSFRLPAPFQPVPASCESYGQAA